MPCPYMAGSTTYVLFNQWIWSMHGNFSQTREHAHSLQICFLPADTTITRRVAATIEVASSVVHWKEYCFRGIKNNNILPGPQQLTREPL